MKSNKKIILTSLTKVLLSIIFVSIILNLVLLGEIIENKKEYKVAINDYNDKKKELTIKSNEREKEFEKTFDKYYSDKLKKIIDEEALVFLAQQQWNYILTINGKTFNNRTIYTEDKNIKIVLAEFSNKEKILPEDILIKGTLTGGDPNDNIDSYLDIMSLVDYNKYEEKEKDAKRICYEFKNIPKGTIITIKISEILKNRLKFKEKMNIDDNILEIIVR